MRRGPRWSQNGRGPLGDPKAQEVPWPMLQEPRCSPNQGGPLDDAGGGGGARRSQSKEGAHAQAAGVLSGPKAKEAPSPIWWGPRWSQSKGGPLAHAVGASVIPKRRRSPRPCGRSLFGLQTKEAPSTMRGGGGGLGGPQAKKAHARAPRVLSGPHAKEAPSPMRQGPGGLKARGGPAPMRSETWWCCPKTPTRCPYPPAAQAGLEGLGCIRRCVEVEGVVSPRNPHGASLSPSGPSRTGGNRVYPPLCGGGW